MRAQVNTRFLSVSTLGILNMLFSTEIIVHSPQCQQHEEKEAFVMLLLYPQTFNRACMWQTLKYMLNNEQFDKILSEIKYMFNE